MQRFIRLSIFMLALLLCGCVTPTPYQPKGLLGGYSEEQIDIDVYLVSFSGNGATSADTVWYYWVYRCAELTRQKGYDYFTLSKYSGKEPTPKSGAFGLLDHSSYATWHDDGLGSIIPVRGHGGGSYYYYSPGGYAVITSWQSSAFVSMFKKGSPSGGNWLLDAQRIINQLDPYVKSNDTSVVLGRKVLLFSALVPPTDAAPPNPI